MTDFTSFKGPGAVPSARPVRILIGTAAALLAGFGVWATSTEWLRPAGSGTVDVDRAHLAASIGFVRGDLWGDYAVALLRSARRDSAATARDEARRAGRTAAGLAPFNAEAWLIVAELAVGEGTPAADVAGLLNMSFLTGPNAVDLMPRRLALVARSPARDDADIRALASRDVRILAQHARGTALLEAAWRSAAPDGRAFLAGLFRDADTRLLPALPGIR